MTPRTPTAGGVDRSRKEGGPADSGRCTVQAVSRARGSIRRYCAANRLRYQWTLTYRGAGEHDLGKVHRHVERLMAKVVKARHGRRFPYVWVPELHAAHGLHVHIAVGFRFEHGDLMLAWGRGGVWCQDMKRKGESALAGARRAAGYLAKDLGKALGESGFGRHRYGRAQGFEPQSFRVRRRDMDDGEAYAAAVFGCRPSDVWRSESVPDWAGPCCRVLHFPVRAPE